jgi:hypothetical protein
MPDAFAQCLMRAPRGHHPWNDEVAAVGSRDIAKAWAFADRCGIAVADGSYDELLADTTIDVISNPTNDGYTSQGEGSRPQGSSARAQSAVSAPPSSFLRVVVCTATPLALTVTETSRALRSVE